MKLQAKSIFAFLLTLALSTCAPPDREPRLRLSVENPNLVVGQEVTVDVLVENAPVIYGADVRLVFDPNLLEVVDADESQDGVQPAHGNFLDPAQSFILQYLADNETGGIDYALALLNPAPPVQGDGLLAQATFRATAEGQATISIEDGLFGNQAGETIAPLLDSIEISIGANQPPTANAGGPYSVDEGGSVTVTATGNDPEGGPLDFAWDLDDDGAFETPGQSVIFLAAQLDGPDSRTITVQVTDNGGLTATAPAAVDVLDVAPTVSAWATPTLTQPRQEITFGGAFADPGLLDTHTIEWDFGDGTTATGSLTVSHAYALGGVYTATLTITDDDGGTGQAVVSLDVCCELYPIALHIDTLAGVEVGQEIEDIYNGGGPGNFGWLSWTGNPSVPTLVQSLTPPGDSDTYVNPYDPDDHTLSLGDWVHGKHGVSNAKSVRDALDNLKSYVITVPVWDEAAGEGNNLKYHEVGFANIQITDYHLPGPDRISAIFWGSTTCPDQ